MIRPPSESETAALVRLFEGELAHYRAHPEAARAAAGLGEKGANAAGDAAVVAADAAATNAAELAAWTIVCNVILNLDEVLTRG